MTTNTKKLDKISKIKEDYLSKYGISYDDDYKSLTNDDYIFGRGRDEDRINDVERKCL